MALDPQKSQALRRRVRLERWATVLAHVVHYGAHRAHEVAARFGLDGETWLALDEAWSSELAEAYRRQQNLVAARFASTFFRARAELARTAPPLEAIGDDAAPVVAAAAHPAEPVPQRVAASFQLAPTPPSSEGSATSAASTPGPAPAPAPAPDAAPRPRPAPPAGGLHGKTADIPLGRLKALRGKEMPFVKPDDPVAIPLETYARITVRLAKREERSKVLEELKLDEATWLASARRWSDRLRADEALMQSYVELVGRLKSEGG